MQQHFCAGMQDVDDQTSRSLLDFSYHLAIGDMQEARKVGPQTALPVQLHFPLRTSCYSWRQLIAPLRT